MSTSLIWIMSSEAIIDLIEDMALERDTKSLPKIEREAILVRYWSSKGRKINRDPVSSGERERIEALKKNKDEASFPSKVFISFSPGFILFLDDGKTSKLRLKSLPSSLLEKRVLLKEEYDSCEALFYAGLSCKEEIVYGKAQGKWLGRWVEESSNRPWRTEPTYVAKYRDDLWLGVKGQPRSDKASFLKNYFSRAYDVDDLRAQVIYRSDETLKAAFSSVSSGSSDCLLKTHDSAKWYKARLVANGRTQQAPHAWFQRFASYALRIGFSSSRCDSSLFIYRHGTEVAYLLIYVDDIVLTASSTNLLQPLKRILRYVRGTLDFRLQLYASIIAKRQHTLSRSSAEAEYRGVANVVAETAWLRNLLRELHTPLLSVTLVYCDNVSAIYMIANPVKHQRTKHIEIDIHFVRDVVARGQVRVLHVPSRY
nr:ribonuclease H-like domain-containing protein [Tanacetum cinerariifolium]